MIKIIREGIKEFNLTCPFCSCEFTYEKEDIHNSQVICPCCSTNIPVRTVNTNTFQTPIWYNQPVVPDGYKIRGGLNKPLPNRLASSDNWSGCEKCPVATSCGGWTCRERFEKWLQSEYKGETNK